MVLKELFGLITGVLISSVVAAQNTVSQKIKTYNKIGNLKVDTSFNKTYLKDFMVPYQEFADLHNCKIKVKSKNIKTY